MRSFHLVVLLWSCLITNSVASSSSTGISSAVSSSQTESSSSSNSIKSSSFSSSLTNISSSISSSPTTISSSISSSPTNISSSISSSSFISSSSSISFIKPNTSVCAEVELYLNASYILGSAANLTEFEYQFIQDVSKAANASNTTDFIVSVNECYEGFVVVLFCLNSSNSNWTAQEELAYLESQVNITQSVLLNGTVTYAVDQYVGFVPPGYFLKHQPASVAAPSSSCGWWCYNGLNYWLVIGFSIFAGILIIMLTAFLIWWYTLPATAPYSVV